MIDKRINTLAEAVAGIKDGALVIAGGFGAAGQPDALLDALNEAGVRDLTVVSNNAGTGKRGLAGLIAAGRVRKVICTYPKTTDSSCFDAAYKAGTLELEIVPQGTLSERIRAAGAGLGGVYTPTGAGTRLAEGKETKIINGREYVLELALHADVALLKAKQADRWGNLTYRMAARNFNPVMATAAKLTIVEVDEFVELGALDPETIVTPGIFIDRVVRVGGRK
jgi:3-oxoadipate CoA-transferase alpha subunit